LFCFPKSDLNEKMESFFPERNSSSDRKCTFLFAEISTSLFAEIGTLLFAKKCTLLFTVYTSMFRLFTTLAEHI